MADGAGGLLNPITGFTLLSDLIQLYVRHPLEALPGVEPESGRDASELCCRYTKRHIEDAGGTFVFIGSNRKEIYTMERWCPPAVLPIFFLPGRS